MNDFTSFWLGGCVAVQSVLVAVMSYWNWRQGRDFREAMDEFRRWKRSRKTASSDTQREFSPSPTDDRKASASEAPFRDHQA